MKHLKTILKIIWFVICFAGNLYQIQQVTSDYVSYQIVTTINVNFPDDFIPPAMSVCLFEQQIVNWTRLLKVKPKIMEEMNFTDMSHDEILEELKSQNVAAKRKSQGLMYKGLDLKTRSEIIFQFEELFRLCTIVKKDGARQSIGKCKDLFDIKSYRFVYYVCWQFNFKSDNYSLEFLRVNRAETIIGFLYYFLFTPLVINVSSEAVFAFNTNHDLDRLGYFRFLYLSELQNLISLSYDEYSNSLLEAPYSTMCRKYKLVEEGVDVIDRGTCYESCLIAKAEKILGENKILPGIFVMEEAIKKRPEMEIVSVYELYSNDTLVDLKDNISHECDLKCSAPACEETFHVPTIRSSIEYAFPCTLTYIMQSPKIETICDPKLSFVVFLTNLFSTFGFWMGASLFGLLENLIGVVEQFVSKRIEEEYKRVSIINTKAEVINKWMGKQSNLSVDRRRLLNSLNSFKSVTKEVNHRKSTFNFPDFLDFNNLKDVTKEVNRKSIFNFPDFPDGRLLTKIRRNNDLLASIRNNDSVRGKQSATFRNRNNY